MVRVKEESKKAGLKLNIQKTKIMVSGPITSRQRRGKSRNSDFIFLGSKITVDGNCSHPIKRHLFLKRKAMTNLGTILKKKKKIRHHIKKQRHPFANKSSYSQGYDFFHMDVRVGP